MNRRLFLSGLATTAAGLILPYQPQRVYSFASNRYVQAKELAHVLAAKNLIFETSLPAQINEIFNWNAGLYNAMYNWVRKMPNQNDKIKALPPAIIYVDPSA